MVKQAETQQGMLKALEIVSTVCTGCTKRECNKCDIGEAKAALRGELKDGDGEKALRLQMAYETLYNAVKDVKQLLPIPVRAALNLVEAVRNSVSEGAEDRRQLPLPFDAGSQ